MDSVAIWITAVGDRRTKPAFLRDLPAQSAAEIEFKSLPLAQPCTCHTKNSVSPPDTPKFERMKWKEEKWWKMPLIKKTDLATKWWEKYKLDQYLTCLYIDLFVNTSHFHLIIHPYGVKSVKTFTDTLQILPKPQCVQELSAFAKEICPNKYKNDLFIRIHSIWYVIKYI